MESGLDDDTNHEVIKQLECLTRLGSTCVLYVEGLKLEGTRSYSGLGRRVSAPSIELPRRTTAA